MHVSLPKMPCLMLLVFLWATPSTLTAQHPHFEQNERVCFCVGIAPQAVIELDNNWEILLALRHPRRLEQLDALLPQLTHSQLLLLQDWKLIRKNNDQTLETTIPLLDSMRTTTLRRYSAALAAALVEKIRPDVQQLLAQLKGLGQAASSYTILFAYVIDGLVWAELEKGGYIEKRELTLENPHWGGAYWTLYPKRNFSSGTNSISANGYSLLINWTEELLPMMQTLLSRWDLQEKMLAELSSLGKIQDQEIIRTLGKYQLFDEQGNLKIVLIEENPQQPLYAISRKIASAVTHFLASEVELNKLKDRFHFASASQALIILYHEVIWEVMDALEREQLLDKPAAFQHPQRARPADISDLVLILKP